MSTTNNSPTSSTDGSAFPWILEHLLAYPASYEIPLRTMYTLNSAPQAQPHSRLAANRPGTPSLSNGSSTDSSPASPDFPIEQQHQLAAHAATEHFKSCLMNHVRQLPSQPFSLPPAFITSFVRRCFSEELCLVDFTQALTALDYLKDLENRRKRELSLALQRLGVNKDTFVQEGNETSRKYPGVSTWLLSMQEKERKVEALYTQVYIGLRRWTLINEMRLEPFNKANSIAMLNTLYPPTTAAPPTRQLTSTILADQRNGFWRYIQGVERNGKGILNNLEHHGKRPGDANGWIIIRETVDKYLRTANGVIEECLDVADLESFNPDSEQNRHNGRRADSGVSFATGDRPSTSGSTGSKSAPSNKPLPSSPVPTTLPAQQPQKKKGSTLEKITRELRKMRSRNDIKEVAKKEEKEKTRSLKKMKSTGNIRGGALAPKHARMGSAGDHPFDINEIERQRMIWEATKEKENRAPGGKTKSYEVA